MGICLIFYSFQLSTKSFAIIPYKIYLNSTNLFNSTYSKIINITWTERSNTQKPEKLFWYDDRSVIARTSDCDKYFKESVPVLGVHEEHENTSNAPLAFSHLVHSQSAILEVFLSIYFRPNNFYCIHVDKKSNITFKTAIANLIRCYSNKTKQGEIFTLSEIDSFSVDWGGNTMLKADLKCLSKLLELNQRKNQTFRWSHSASIAGSELPIVTYPSFRDKITQKLGTDLSSVESFVLPPENFFRLSVEQNKDSKAFQNGSLQENIFEISNPLNNSTIATSSYNSSNNNKIEFKVFKGIRNVILSSKDVDFLLNNEISKEFLNWFSKGSFTEEHFYSTVIRFHIDTQNSNSVLQNTSSEQIRQNSGGITFTSGNTLHGICPRFTDWYCSDCFGECYNAICNFNIKDLSKVQENSTECLIANKFNLDVDPSAVSQHWINIITKMSSEGNNDQRLSYWSNVKEKIYKLTKN